MSDSDCSNCNDLSCEYRPDDHYNCYKTKMKTLSKIVNKKDIDYLLNLSEKIDKQEDIDYSYTGVVNDIKGILFLFNDALKFKENNNNKK